MPIEVALTINNRPVKEMVEPRMLLATLLRERLGLTGTHIGCDTSQCGCCTVLMDGDAVKSCTVLAVQSRDASITTIEGLAAGGQLHPVQEAFREHHGLQCGFCTPGFVMSIVELVAKHDNLTEAEVRNLLDGNICRCTGYHNIVKATLAAARGPGAARVAGRSASEAIKV